MKQFLIFLLSLFIGSITNITAMATPASNTPTPDESKVKDAFYQWCNALGKAHGNANVMLKFYAPDAVLLPTLSHNVLSNQKGDMATYFTKLTSYPNIACTPQKLITRMYQNTAINTGLYKFTYTDTQQKTVTIPARFTFVYEETNGSWLIIKHHSSKMPE